MWVPMSETELRQALATGTLRETATFEAKSALPPAGKNRDLAKDICAMTVDGGVLVYGIGGPDRTRPDTLTPVVLAGAPERIDQVAQTSISEPPNIEIHDFPAASTEGMGYVVVAVPASPRAPHMVTLDGDNRFYGRGATGNRKLTEGEIARLYQRREQWEIDREQWLATAIDEMPFAFDQPTAHVGPMLVMVRPTAAPAEMLRRAAAAAAAAAATTIEDFLQEEFLPQARKADPYPDQGSPGLGDAFQVGRSGADIWLLRRDTDATLERQAYTRLSAAGELRYYEERQMWRCNTLLTLGACVSVTLVV
jgi:hypothetical protein